MYINRLEPERKIIKVAIPLTKGTDKTRIKKRSMFNEYGIPVSTRQEKFTQSCYVEWQIGYDVITSDIEKLEKTTMPDKRFTGANTKEKALYELSEYIKYFYDWGVVSEQSLLSIKQELADLPEQNCLDFNEDLCIRRTHPVPKNINGIDYLWTKVEYPLLVHRFGNYEIITEIIIKEKQYAIGTQPMLYLCFPITELENSHTILGRTANAKEFANFVINEENINIFLEMLKIFGNLSKNHKQDVISIIDVILDT